MNEAEEVPLDWILLAQYHDGCLRAVARERVYELLKASDCYQ